MKNLISLLPIFLLFFSTNTFAQASKKISQMVSFDKNISTLKINVNSSKVEILQTKGSRIYIEMTVKSSIGSVHLLEYLGQKGRYELSQVMNSSEKKITLIPNLEEKTIIVKREEIKETITYKIFIPDNILFVQTLDTELMSSVASN